MTNLQTKDIATIQLSLLNTTTATTTPAEEEINKAKEVFEALAFEKERYPFGYGSSFML